MLEYQSGRKLVGNLDNNPFIMNEVKGITSIASYFARGNMAVAHGEEIAVVF